MSSRSIYSTSHNIPPVPPMPARSMSVSTTSSSAYSKSNTVSDYRTASPQSEMTPSSPVSTTRALGDTRRGSWDEVDKLGYTYSLRVAHVWSFSTRGTADRSLLQQTLSNPRPANGSSSPLPSPSITGTSPSGSRLSLGLSSPKSPNWPAPASPTTPIATRRKSSFGLGKKNKEDALKLPKEFLLEFWNTLAAEEGDADWSDAVAAFLGMIKKGTKTPSGLNLREIPTLLDGESMRSAARLGTGTAH